MTSRVAPVRPRRSRRLSAALKQRREARLALIAEYKVTEAAELAKIIERLEVGP